MYELRKFDVAGYGNLEKIKEFDNAKDLFTFIKKGTTFTVGNGASVFRNGEFLFSTKDYDSFCLVKGVNPSIRRIKEYLEDMRG